MKNQSLAQSNPISITWLSSPWAMLLSVVLGIYIGTFQTRLAQLIAPFGIVYLGLLKMCVIPILLSAISNSIGRLMKSQNAGQYVRRILIVFPLGLLIVSIIALTLAQIAGPGKNLTASTLETLGVLVHKSGLDLEISLTGPLSVEKQLDLSSLLLELVPENIFNALSEGQTLKVLIFAMIFGISLGILQQKSTETIFNILDSIYQTFNQIINWLTVVLPFGLCSLLANQLSKVGLDVIFSMLNFIIVVIATFAIIYCLSTLVIWRQTKFSLLSVISALREPTILALVTTSSLACLPASISALTKKLKFDRQTINLVAPLSITLCRFGSVIYFALASVFVAQLYQTQLGWVELFIIVIGSIFAGMATSGVTGILTLTMLSLVLDQLELPIDAVLVLFIAIDPIMDPFRTLGIVHTGIAATAAIADSSKQKKGSDSSYRV